MGYSWIGKQINEMTLIEMKSCLEYTKQRLAHYRNLKAFGYDRNEANPKIKSLVERKKALMAAIKASK